MYINYNVNSYEVLKESKLKVIVFIVNYIGCSWFQEYPKTVKNFTFHQDSVLFKLLST